MRVIDSNSKGKGILQNRGGVYISVEMGEIEEAIKALELLKQHRDNDLPRFQIDARKY